MSFGSLSKNAIMALNQGAKMDKFAHNTGKGGISPYPLQGGDLIFQAGTGYFGAGKSVDGKRVFDDAIFKENAIRPEVKMIEIKFSQGAKPGHGGILPAKKNTPEIAKIRAVKPG
jgi:glutamate synthase domain-containing protein 2